ncbi:MAG: squalene--hopene cyclase [Candidatus Methylacidiphilales bacterium]
MSAGSQPSPKTISVPKQAFRVALAPAEVAAPELDAAISRTQEYLLGLQKPDGHWVGELIVDSTLCADYILFMHWWGAVNFTKQAKCVKHLLDRQLSDGGWNIYVGGPSELNATVKAYFALKLAGFHQDDTLMRKAHATILRLGGIPRTMTYTRLLLALFGQFPWKHLPIIPVEMILLPNWLYVNIYDFSAWSRTMLIPLAIINHCRPVRHVPAEAQLHELYPYGTEHDNFSPQWSKKWVTWRNFFLRWDATLKFVDKLPYKPFRSLALKKAEEWLVDRIDPRSDGLGAIFPGMMYTCIAIKSLGYSDDHPVLRKALKDFDDLHVDDIANDDFRIQPCFSPIWDTAITGVALTESGLNGDHPALKKAADYIISKEVRRTRGDWAVNNNYPENSGWAFEYNNEFYPDVDDTFKVLLALQNIKTDDEENKKVVMHRALKWAISFQCKNGGFAAFDKDVTKKWLDEVPFADHNAILDPPCSDITSRGLEVFGRMGMKRSDPVVRRAIKFIRDTQLSDGSWLGRWGINYIYGTFLVLRGLQAIGEDMNQDWILRGRDWLESCQNEDGGWGESAASYDDPRLKGQGPTTPSQTAWSLIGILACGNIHRPSVLRGIHNLLTTQLPDGSWKEDYITGTGFPKVFYLKYDMYRINWPLLALGEYRRQADKLAISR